MIYPFHQTHNYAYLTHNCTQLSVKSLAQQMHKNHCTDSRHTPQTQCSKVLLAASWTTQIRNQCWAGAYWTASTTSKNTSFPCQSCNSAFCSLVAEWSQQEALTSGCFLKSSEHMLTHKNIHMVMHYDAKLVWCWQGLPYFEIQNPGWKPLSGTHWYTYTAVKRDVASLPMASYKGACKFHSWYWCMMRSLKTSVRALWCRKP